MNNRVKTRQPVRAGIPSPPPYTFTRSIPELGESFLQIYRINRGWTTRQAGLRPPLHPLRVIDPGPARDQPRPVRIPDESHRFPWDG